MNKITSHIIADNVEQYKDTLVKYRRYLHQYPELSFNEINTSKFVYDSLKKIGIDDVKFICNTGVVAFISIKNSKSCIAYRADLDALPIQEDNNVSYKSKNDGIMHACGHDVHTAILLCFAEILWKNKNNLKNSVKLIFQPGEEKNPGGASMLIKEGVLTMPKVDAIYGLHVYPEFKVGEFGYKIGIYMASSDEIYIKVKGKGGHGALPHNCIDTVLIASQIIVSLQQLVSRIIPSQIPAVLSFGYIDGKGSTNIIPEIVELRGTFRCMDEKWRKKGLKKIKEIANLTSLSYGGKTEVEINKGYPVLINNEQMCVIWQEKMKKYFNENQIKKLDIRMTSEDFAFYSQKIPSFFFRLGVCNKENKDYYGVHHPKFDIDEDAMIYGVKSFVLTAFL